MQVKGLSSLCKVKIHISTADSGSQISSLLLPSSSLALKQTLPHQIFGSSFQDINFMKHAKH